MPPVACSGEYHPVAGMARTRNGSFGDRLEAVAEKNLPTVCRYRTRSQELSVLPTEASDSVLDGWSVGLVL